MNIELIPVPGLPFFQEGDDLVDILVTALQKNSQSLEHSDILVVAQKIVSKVEGRLVPLNTVKPSSRAIELAAAVEKDPRLVELILQESTEVVRQKPGVLIVRHRLGFVGANAGIDQSNIEHQQEHEGSALLLPIDPDVSAANIHEGILRRLNINVGVIVADSANRPWRLGTIGIAIGAANTLVLDDRRGGTDLFRRELKITMTARADSIATAANLVMGETSEGIPVCIVRGIDAPSTLQNAAVANRAIEDDLFT